MGIQVNETLWEIMSHAMPCMSLNALSKNSISCYDRAMALENLEECFAI